MEIFSAILALCAEKSPVTGEFPSQSQWRGALMFSLSCAWINGWVNNSEAGDLRRHRVFMFKVFHEDVPNVFDNFFTYNYTIHEHNTRSAQHLHIPLRVSNLTKTGIRYQGPIIWNNILKAEINPMCSEASFKIMMKKCLFNIIIKLWIMSYNIYVLYMYIYLK